MAMFPVPALPMLALPAAPPGIMPAPAAPIMPAPAPVEAPPAAPEAIGVAITPCSDGLFVDGLVLGPVLAAEAAGEGPSGDVVLEPSAVEPGPL
jgi:hypothetical protein